MTSMGGDDGPASTSNADRLRLEWLDWKPSLAATPTVGLQKKSAGAPAQSLEIDEPATSITVEWEATAEIRVAPDTQIAEETSGVDLPATAVVLAVLAWAVFAGPFWSRDPLNRTRHTVPAAIAKAATDNRSDSVTPCC